jgi:hypothetical protein
MADALVPGSQREWPGRLPNPAGAAPPAAGFQTVPAADLELLHRPAGARGLGCLGPRDDPGFEDHGPMNAQAGEPGRASGEPDGGRATAPRPTELRLALLLGVLLTAGVMMLLARPAAPPLAGRSPAAAAPAPGLDRLLAELARDLAEAPNGPWIVDNATPESLAPICACPWSAYLSPGSDVLLLPGDQPDRPTAYFVRTYSQTPGDRRPALCRHGTPGAGSGDIRTACPGSGVEQLQIELGLDRDGDRVPDRFMPVTQFPATAVPSALRLLVLVRTAGNTPAHRDQRTYEISNAAPYTPGDAHQRRFLTRLVPVGRPADQSAPDAAGQAAGAPDG